MVDTRGSGNIDTSANPAEIKVVLGLNTHDFRRAGRKNGLQSATNFIPSDVCLVNRVSKLTDPRTGNLQPDLCPASEARSFAGVRGSSASRPFGAVGAIAMKMISRFHKWCRCLERTERSFSVKKSCSAWLSAGPGIFGNGSIAPKECRSSELC